MEKLEVRRSKNGYAVALVQNGQDVLKLSAGAVVNEYDANVDKFVERYNELLYELENGEASAHSLLSAAYKKIAELEFQLEETNARQT